MFDSKDYISSVERDAASKARDTLASVKKERGGKFKLSERQFLQVAEDLWMGAELSGAERVMRIVEGDTDIVTKDDVRAVLHLYVLSLFNKVKRRLNLAMSVTLDDLVHGKYSTEYINKERERSIQ